MKVFLNPPLPSWKIRKIINNSTDIHLKRLNNKTLKLGMSAPTPNLAMTKPKKNKKPGPRSDNKEHINTEQNSNNVLSALQVENTELKQKILSLEKHILEFERTFASSEPNCTQTQDRLQLPVQNRFDILDESMDSEVVDEVKTPQLSNSRKRPLTNSSAKLNTAKRINNRAPVSHSSEQNITNRLLKPSPINIFDYDPKLLTSIVKSTIADANFSVKRINDKKLTLKVDSSSHHKKIIEALQKSDTKFFSYTRKEDIFQTWLVKGVSPTYSEEEILEELNSLVPQDVVITKVSRFTTRAAEANGYHLPIFMVQLTAASNPKGLSAIKVVAHHVVTCEKLKRREILQCKRCQRLGHAAINCNFPYRCVKCKINHGPENCAISNANKDTLYCINCNTFGHPASYRGCPKIKEITDSIKSKSKPSIIPKITEASHRTSNYRYVTDHLS